MQEDCISNKRLGHYLRKYCIILWRTQHQRGLNTVSTSNTSIILWRTQHQRGLNTVSTSNTSIILWRAQHQRGLNTVVHIGTSWPHVHLPSSSLSSSLPPMRSTPSWCTLTCWQCSCPAAPHIVWSHLSMEGGAWPLGCIRVTRLQVAVLPATTPLSPAGDEMTVMIASHHHGNRSCESVP